MRSNCRTFNENVQKAYTEAYATARAMRPLRQECKRLKELLADRPRQLQELSIAQRCLLWLQSIDPDDEFDPDDQLHPDDEFDRDDEFDPDNQLHPDDELDRDDEFDPDKQKF